MQGNAGSVSGENGYVRRSRCGGRGDSLALGRRGRDELQSAPSGLTDTRNGSRRWARLGPYEVLSALGAGGMGEVYRARDTKLNRDVALKVLSNAFARDAQRMARFRREAQVLASLNHPNI